MSSVVLYYANPAEVALNLQHTEVELYYGRRRRSIQHLTLLTLTLSLTLTLRLLTLTLTLSAIQTRTILQGRKISLNRYNCPSLETENIICETKT